MSPWRSFQGLVVSLRPRQWVKNGLVVVAPAAAGQLSHGATWRHTAIAFAAFSLAASGLYLINDLLDRPADRQHPTKRLRPIPAGLVPTPLAVVSAVTLLVSSLMLALFTVANATGLTWVLATYVVLTLAYGFGLKKEPVIELVIVASGFFLRAIAGAEASHLFISTWFLVVTAFAALFLVSGKRSAELAALGENAASHRRVLGFYTPSFLRSTLTMCSAVIVTGYCLWAFDVSTTGLSSVRHNIVPIRLTVVPVVIAILHILRRLEQGDGGAPEDLVFTDRTLQLLGIAWTALFAIGIYA